jgi:hypothetical protein
MANTPAQQIPYASPADAPDVPYWSKKQAERTDALVSNIYAALAKLPVQMVSGSDSIAITTAQTSVTKTITLPAGFAVAPFVVLQNTSNFSGRGLLLNLYVNGTTKDQFTVKMATADGAQIGTSYTLVFNWQASL